MHIYPSNAGVWFHCAGSPTVSEPFYTKQPDSDAKKEGVCAHWVLELLAKEQPVKEGDLHDNGKMVTDDMIEHAEGLLEMLPPLRPEDVEKRFTCDDLWPGMVGKADIAFDMDSELVLVDYKYGHAPVDAFENEQLMVTAAALADPARHKTIRMIVYQPRCFRGDGPVSEWAIDYSRFSTQYLPRVKEAVKEANGPNPDVNTGSHCRNCVGKHACKALHATSMSIVDMTQAASILELPAEALGRELATLQDAQERLKARVTGLEQQAQLALEKGQTVAGFQLVNAVGNLSWVAPKDKVLQLGDLLGVDLRKAEEPITPTQAINAGVDEATVKGIAKRASKGVELKRIKLNKLKEVFKNG